MDIAQLENPQEHVLSTGGEIFFLLKNEVVAGVCAMVPHGSDTFELAKMAVDPRHRGKGYGDLLIQHCIQWAQEKRVSKISLLFKYDFKSGHFYKKHGFKTVHLGRILIMKDAIS